ncbi:DNA internalization-related competence protein ComEC/Rec2 [Neisseria animalis]|uniref:DNA internalization-related competence protein ComEC/Rec2 n=1 Tax=Neisseria animalis TaxID=492 RepID=A0A5P3MPG3_NEIAN|nr:DNA internalization-related competence protein ComEC/Rec2 [Neisseria animalis]QEY23300.1 DNA internalization-related competence protein ComEC/Rec2 [Neisseria animalis]ROW31946.1 DNA internalization-related competence protein ComEC/Rec2 [Neisseria animalis]VEE08619.1 competence protein ComA [Neisseria animalis]
MNPNRPFSIPATLLRFILPCWVIGVVLSFALPAIPHWAVWPSAFALLAAAGLRWRTAWLLLVLLLGTGYGVWRTENALSAQWPLHRSEAAELTIEVADIPRINEKRVQFTATARHSSGQTFTLLLSDYQLRDWAVGSRWQVSARVRPVIGEVNLRGFNRETWALANGIGGVGTIGKVRQPLADGSRANLTALRETVSRRWQHTPEYGHDFADGIALMRALSIGEQSALRPELWQAFRPLGLTHLVSISGLHVTMIALMAGWLVKQFLRRLPFTPAKPRLWILFGGLSAALLYAGMAGFGVPTQRSILMLAAFAWTWWRSRTSSVWAGWWQALAAVLLLDPLSVLGVGTWLSFGLVAALIWGSSGRLQIRGLQTALRGQWAASVCSIVLLGHLFAALPLISPIINAIAIPWFSWVLTPLALSASALPFTPLQWTAAALAEYTLRFLLWLAAYAPEWPVAAAPLPLTLFAAAASLLILLPRGLGLRPLAWLVLAAFVFYRPEKVETGRLQITVMDSGQGLSVLLQTARRTLLFDTATLPTAVSNIIPTLNALGIRRLDALVLSHHDNDHDGGFAAVQQYTQPATLWAGQPEYYPNAQPCRRQQWQWDNVWFEFLTLPAHDNQADNDQSCILRAVAGGEAILLTGDLAKKGELALLEQYGSKLYSQVLILGHHGSNSASSGTFLNTVSPQYAVASSGYGNAYGHPTPAVQTRVSAHGITLLRTDQSGALRFELGSGEPYRGRLQKHKFYWQKKPFDYYSRIK